MTSRIVSTFMLMLMLMLTLVFVLLMAHPLITVSAASINCTRASEPCLNGGTCSSATDECLCHTYWFGPQCRHYNCSAGGCNGQGDCHPLKSLNCSACAHGWRGVGCNVFPVSCPRDCFGHGHCVDHATERNESICVCQAQFQTKFCEFETRSGQGDSWATTLWIVFVAVVGIICFERLYSSCKRVYLKRTGRLGFQPLPRFHASEDESRRLTSDLGHIHDDDDDNDDDNDDDIRML